MNITITPVNDNGPSDIQLVNAVLDSNGNVSVDENTPDGTFIADIQIIDADGVEEEADAITSQVLAELGVEMDSKMVGLSAPSAKPQGEEALLTEEEQDALGDALPDLKARLDAL